MSNTQAQADNFDLTSGHKEYDAKIKDIQGIFNKIEKIIDLSKYKEEFNEVLSDAKKDPALSNEFAYPSIQMTYEGFVYDKYSNRLDEIIKKLNKEEMPFYELYLLSNKIDDSLSKVSGENIGDIISQAKFLLNRLNELDTHNKKEKNNIIDLAYKTIYQVIVIEELFDRSDVLDYVKRLNIPVNIENIGRLLTKDLGNIDKRNLIDLDLKNLKTEGLGYDYLDRNVIRVITKKTIGNVDSDYQERRKKAFDYINLKEKSIRTELSSEEGSLERRKDNIKRRKKELMKCRAAVLSLFAVPVILSAVGGAVGKKESNKIDEYKTVTRTVNAITGEVIGAPEETYDEKETTYVATFTVQEPWQLTSSGRYVRKVTAYDYVPQDVSQINNSRSYVDMFESNIVEKYKYLETKETLDENDNTEDSTILITETFQDKTDTIKSTKYTMPFAATGVILGLLFDLFIIIQKFDGVYNMTSVLDTLKKDVKSSKLSEKQIIDRIETLKKELLLLEKEREEAIMKYGKLGETFAFEEFSDLDSYEKRLI